MSARALAAFPAGSNGEFDLPADMVRVIERGEGCRVWDAGGREFLDFSVGWGSALAGHAHPQIVEAVRARALKGTNFATVTTESLSLAEELLRIQPMSGRQVRFCASGTEATMYCMRLARAYTRRRLILKFEGAYHGSNDEGVTSLFPSGITAFPSPEPSSAGVNFQDTIVTPFNDAAACEAAIAAHAGQLAGVIVEPLHRCLAPMPGFLESLRRSCDRHQVPLIFDEVVTGFRLAYGGAQEYYKVPADLVAYGKALGGGLPIGAFVGRTEIMQQVEEHRAGTGEYVWTASTLGGNPLSCAGANAALDVYSQPECYTKLADLGHLLRDCLRRALRDSGHVGQVIGDGPLGQIVFSDRPVTDYRSTISGNRRKSRAMMLGLFRAGIFVNPMGTKLYLSLAHTPDVVEEFTARLTRVLGTLGRD
ncbi:MAG: aminotransferase class III-fold pyridoxal phosphate-dependent enzyme [Planctomycetota bacterium]|nr:aminotransferase class III-fold pyridoxal phosphate-dependent enzyme [Planctomycetota bacterium]